MSTAEALTAVEVETAFALRLATNIRTLLANRRVSTEAAYQHIGVSRGTWFSRLKTGHWSAFELDRLADLFGVEVGNLYSDPETLDLRSRCFSPLTLIHGGKDGHLFDPDTFAPAVEVSPERPTLTLVQG